MQVSDSVRMFLRPRANTKKATEMFSTSIGCTKRLKKTLFLVYSTDLILTLSWGAVVHLKFSFMKFYPAMASLAWNTNNLPPVCFTPSYTWPSTS